MSFCSLFVMSVGAVPGFIDGIASCFEGGVVALVFRWRGHRPWMVMGGIKYSRPLWVVRL